MFVTGYSPEVLPVRFSTRATVREARPCPRRADLLRLRSNRDVHRHADGLRGVRSAPESRRGEDLSSARPRAPEAELQAVVRITEAAN